LAVLDGMSLFAHDLLQGLRHVI
jgi:hypothetical protein